MAECNSLTAQVNSLELHQKSLIARNGELNTVLHHKTTDVQEHESLLVKCEGEINTLNG